MDIEFIGRVAQVLPLRSGMGQRGPWSRATVVFEIEDGNYTTKLAVENGRDAERFSKLMVGSNYHVDAKVSSREYQGRWYTQVEAWRWTARDPAPPSQTYGGTVPKDMPF